MDTLTKYQEWLEKEYKDAVRAIDSLKNYFTPKQVVDNSCQRALGAFFFIQHLDDTIPYVNLEAVYENFQEKVEKLLDK